jgi:hypothetical protein
VVGAVIEVSESARAVAVVVHLLERPGARHAPGNRRIAPGQRAKEG